MTRKMRAVVLWVVGERCLCILSGYRIELKLPVGISPEPLSIKGISPAVDDKIVVFVHPDLHLIE